MKMPERVRLSVDLIKFLRAVADDKPRRVEDLAVVLGTTKNFLHQIVSQLKKSGVLTVTKGPYGGVRIPEGKLPFTLSEIYHIFGYMNEPITGTLYSAQVENEIRAFMERIVI
jgi:DNA-binding IscR family transcriptional regulator